MQPAASSPTKLLLRPRFKSQDSNTSTATETTTYRINNVTNFPLRGRSRDHLSSLGENRAETVVLSEDRKLYLKLLQAASSPAKSEKHHQPSELSNFDAITPDIINTLDKHQGASPLHYACINGHTFMVKFLLEKGANLNIWDEKKRVTPLMCASAFGRTEIVQILLENDCDIDAGLNSSTDGQDCALLWAVRKGHLPVVRCLLEHDSNQNSTVAFSETPIHAAVMNGSTEILKMLVNAQDKNVKSDFQMGPEKASPIHLAASGEFDNSLELCKILIEEGNVYINSLNVYERTPLHDAVANQNVDIVRYLLTRFAKVNAADKDGRTPIFYALGEDEEALECMQALIDTGKCNVNHQDKWGNTPLHLAGVYSSIDSVELLLMNGSDFSIKADGGASALSILRKKIPTTPALLHKVFDQAVTLTHFDDSPAKRQDSKVDVDFKYVLPAASITTTGGTSPATSPLPLTNGSKPSRFSRVTSMFRELDEEDIQQQAAITRKETSKLKCLVDEQLSSLLLHPVIHSFLELKWQKARKIFLPTLTFKLMLVVLFSIYVQMPYALNGGSLGTDVKSTKVNGTNNSSTTKATTAEIDDDPTPPWFEGMYIVIVVMATLKGLAGLVEILRAPKQQLKTLHPWIAWAVLLIMIFYMKPYHWKSVCTCDPFRRTMAALGILLAWLDVWIDMASFPKIGLSIRVFFQVLKNFSHFILPHCCLLIGFILAFTLLFPDSGEFQSVVMGLTKIIRVMAGDITIVAPGNDKVSPDSDDGVILSHALLVYIYTAYVVMVAIVLGNLLIGLAVNDIQGIYNNAAADKLVKQTLLLNVLENSFHGRWTRFCLPKEIFAKFINLFPSNEPDDKIITFSPFDPSDWQLGSDHKKALLDIGSVNRVSETEKDKRASIRASVKTNRWAKIAFSKRLGKAYADDEQRELMESINKLVLSYLENKTPKT